MAGIYIHIPFCKRKCYYCNFFSVTSVKKKDDFLQALLREIEIRKTDWKIQKFSTVYLGGGTPSLLTINDLGAVFAKLFQCFNIDQNAEITLEANPDDLSPNKIKGLISTPVNRLSIGIQSFFNDDLIYLNRIHSAEEAINCVKSSQDAGFGNLTIDLIYGIPTLGVEKWRENLAVFHSLNIPHLSAYALTVEDKTPLNQFIRKGKIPPPDEAESNLHFGVLMSEMSREGFLHYEISNFALPGYESRHNSSYWKGKPYLGLGPSAHSYNGETRRWNISNLTNYISNVNDKEVFWEQERLIQSQRYNEYVMTSLRTIWGCDLNKIRGLFGNHYKEYCLQNIKKYLDLDYVVMKQDVLYLTNKGKLFADQIASDLFYID